MKLTKKRSLQGLGALAALTLALSGCATAATPAATGPDFDGLGLSSEQEDALTELYDAAVESGDTEVMIYAGHHDEFQPIYEGFQKRFPGLTVKTGTYVGAELQSTLEAERETGNHLVSVISNPNGDRYAEQGFAQPYEVVAYEPNPALEGRIDPTQISDEAHNYYSPWVLMFALSRNTDLIEEADLPTTWAELADKDWDGKITFMNPSTPGGTQTTLAQMLLAGVITEDELRDIADNAKTVATDQLALQSISSGEFPVQPFAAVTSIVTAANNGAPVEAKLFDENNLIATEKWMLAADAPSPDAAKLLLNYLHTTDAQESALSSGSFPINQDESLTSPYGFPPLQDVNFVPLKSQAELRPAVKEYTPLFQSIVAG